MSCWYQPIARKLGFRTQSANKHKATRRLRVLPLEDRITPTGGTVNLTIGTIPGGRSVQVVFDGTIDNVAKGIDRVWNQGTVSGTGFSSVSTDDPTQSGTPAFDPTRTFVDRAPEVSAVFLRSSTWNSTFLTNLQNQGVGDSTFGYRLLDGARQPTIAPWFNLDRISIRFNKNVTASPTSLQLLGANTASYGLTGFTYDATTFTATWTVTGGIDMDKLRIVLASSGVSAVTGGKALDGEWTDNTAVFPSGDGAAGGDFSFRFNVQPGDVDGDGFVNVTDGVLIRKYIAAAPTSVIADLNGNGVVDINDFTLYRPRIGDSQPAGNPGGTPGSGWVASTMPIPPLPLGVAGTTVTATKTAALQNDVNGNGLFDPGDTIRWTITITNTTGSPIDNIALSDMLGFYTTLVAGSAHASPLATNDSYTWAVNTQLDSAARGLPSLLANDTIANVTGGTDAIVATAGTFATTLGGSVTINANGSFVYTPEAGDTGNDTFTYTIANSANPALTSSATVTIGLGTQRVWYVQNGPTNGDGRSNTPFNSPASASTAATGTDIIYVLSDIGANPSLNGAFTLDNNQQLLGQGVSLTVNTVTPFTGSLAGRPTLTNTTGNVITLGTGNTVQGLTLGDTSGIDVSGGTVGTFTMNSVSKVGTGRAIGIATSGTLNVTFDNLTSTSSSVGQVVNLQGVSGTFVVTNGAGTDTSIASAAFGIRISGAAAGAVFTFGDTSIGSSGIGVSLTSNDATAATSFASLGVTTTAGAGFVASTGGQVALSGTTNTISAAGGAAVDLTSTTLTGGATFSTVSSAGSPGSGINLVSVTGAFTANGGSIGTAAGDDVFISGGSSNVTIATNITNTAGHSVQVVSRAGGTVTISGTISDTGTGIRLFGNGSGTISFTNATKTLHTAANTALNIDGNAAAVAMNFTNGGLDITTTTATAFLASGAGTLTVTGGTNSIVTSGAGAAMNVSGITFGAGTTFLTVTSAGGTNNIALSNIAGSLTMSGGTLSGSTGTSFTLTGGNAVVIYLGTVSVTNGQSGVVTSNPTGGSLQFGTVNVSNAGAATNNDAIVMDGNGTNAFDLTIAAATLNATNMNDALQLSDLVSGSDISISGGTFTAAAVGDRVINFATAINLNAELTGVTLNGTNSDGIAFTSTVGGTYSFGNYTANTPNGGIALTVTAGVASITFGALTQSGGTTAVSITGATTGAVTINNGAISGTSGTDFNINAGNANVTYAGTITNAAGNSVAIASHSGGTVNFLGAITDTAGSSGISLTNNTGATINFTGGLSLTTTTNPAFTATGGGTVTATQNNTTIFNNLTTTTGTALNVANTTIGAAGLTFHSISAGTAASGPANGIVLNTTGALGGLHVTGNATTVRDGSGGTIQHTTGNGISLTSTLDVQLTHMNINNSGTNGVFGSAVNGFVSDWNSFAANGNAVNEGGIRFGGTLDTDPTGLTGGAIGSATETRIDNTLINTSFEHGLVIENTSGTLTQLNLTGTTIQNDANGSGFLIETRGAVGSTATATVQIEGSSFLANPGAGVQGNALRNTNLTMNILGNAAPGANTFTGHDTILLGNGDTGHLVADIRNNTISGNGDGIFVGNAVSATSGATLSAKIVSNNVTTNVGGANHSISSLMSGGTSHLLIDSNTVVNNGQVNGINIGTPDDPSGPNFTAKVINNTVTGGSTAANGISLSADVSGPGATAVFKVENNTVNWSASNVNNLDGIFLNQFASSTISLERGSSPSNTASVVLAANNPNSHASAGGPATEVSGTVTVVNNGTIIGPMLSAPGGIQSANPLPPATKLTAAQMAPIFAEAIHRWDQVLTSRALSAALHSATFQIVDLPAGYLGQAPLNGHVISLDVTADGYGWYVDPTPGDDSEFAHAKSSTRFYTDSTLAPAGRMDLLTTVMHELGHVIGLDSSFNPNDREDLMYAYLTTGERRLPAGHAATDALRPAGFVGPLTISPRSESSPRPESPRSQTPFGNADVRNSVSQPSKQSFEGSRSQTEFGNESKVKATAWWMAPIELKKAKRQGPFVSWNDEN